MECSTLNANGGVSGSSPLTITGAGKVSLGAAATHTGTTTIAAGATLRMGAANLLPNGAGTGNLAVNGTLDLNGFPQSVNALGGSGIVDNTGVDAVTLTVGNNDAGGAFGLIKAGAGTLALTGTSTYTGNTVVQGGTLNLGGAGSIETSYPLTLNAGGTLDASAQPKVTGP